MNYIRDISEKRWFMGKGRELKSIDDVDSVYIGNSRLSIVKVTFSSGDSDLYAVIDNENAIGSILTEAFTEGASQNIFPTSKGYFFFSAEKNVPAKYLRATKPVTAEQSNSAFLNPGKIFFKLYRRLLNGTHPEAETLSHLEKAGFNGMPEFFGTCGYKSDSGEIYTIGILEEHQNNVEDAWKFFNRDMDIEVAETLGAETARMHNALKPLKGSGIGKTEVPIEHLQDLLQSIEKNGKCQGVSLETVSKIQSRLPEISEQIKIKQADVIFAPQRIHGDFHLGQVLIEKSNSGDATKTSPGIKIIDFEGEPTRPLEFRRALRSPAVDIAGMLRSFRYAAANSHKDSTAAEQAFVAGYSRISGIAPERILQAAAPYILAKAVYEACYELEFRPDWFWIPAQALL